MATLLPNVSWHVDPSSGNLRSDSPLADARPGSDAPRQFREPDSPTLFTFGMTLDDGGSSGDAQHHMAVGGRSTVSPGSTNMQHSPQASRYSSQRGSIFGGDATTPSLMPTAPSPDTLTHAVPPHQPALQAHAYAPSSPPPGAAAYGHPQPQQQQQQQQPPPQVVLGPDGQYFRLVPVDVQPANVRPYPQQQQQMWQMSAPDQQFVHAPQPPSQPWAYGMTASHQSQQQQQVQLIPVTADYAHHQQQQQVHQQQRSGHVMYVSLADLQRQQPAAATTASPAPSVTAPSAAAKAPVQQQQRQAGMGIRIPLLPTPTSAGAESHASTAASAVSVSSSSKRAGAALQLQPQQPVSSAGLDAAAAPPPPSAPMPIGDDEPFPPIVAPGSKPVGSASAAVGGGGGGPALMAPPQPLPAWVEAQLQYQSQQAAQQRRAAELQLQQQMQQKQLLAQRIAASQQQHVHHHHGGGSPAPAAAGFNQPGGIRIAPPAAGGAAPTVTTQPNPYFVVQRQIAAARAGEPSVTIGTGGAASAAPAVFASPPIPAAAPASAASSASSTGGIRKTGCPPSTVLDPKEMVKLNQPEQVDGLLPDSVRKQLAAFWPENVSRAAVAEAKAKRHAKRVRTLERQIVYSLNTVANAEQYVRIKSELLRVDLQSASVATMRDMVKRFFEHAHRPLYTQFATAIARLLADWVFFVQNRNMLNQKLGMPVDEVSAVMPLEFASQLRDRFFRRAPAATAHEESGEAALPLDGEIETPAEADARHLRVDAEFALRAAAASVLPWTFVIDLADEVALGRRSAATTDGTATTRVPVTEADLEFVAQIVLQSAEQLASPHREARLFPLLAALARHRPVAGVRIGYLIAEALELPSNGWKRALRARPALPGWEEPACADSDDLRSRPLTRPRGVKFTFDEPVSEPASRSTSEAPAVSPAPEDGEVEKTSHC